MQFGRVKAEPLVGMAQPYMIVYARFHVFIAFLLAYVMDRCSVLKRFM